MAESPTESYRFDAFAVDTVRGCLLFGDAEITLRPKSFALLRYLVEHSGRLIGKDELLAAIWPKSVVTDDSLTRCISEVRAALADQAQTIIKTVSRRGYIFTAPVTSVPAIPWAAPAVTGGAPQPARRFPTRPWRPVVLASVAATLLLVIAFGFMFRGPDDVAPRLSIIVLPFIDRGSDASRAYLADSLTDDLTIALARIKGTTVITSGSAATLKDKAVDIRKLGADLHVRYAVRGSVSGDASRTRVSVELIDAPREVTLWADNFDAASTDRAQMTDSIVWRLASTLQVKLVEAESQRSARLEPGNQDEEDLALQCEASAALQAGETGRPAYELCERALEVDPRNVRALVRLASYLADRVSRVQSPDAAADIARADVLVTRALAVDPVYYLAHCAKALVLEDQHRLREAVGSAERCQALNPSYAGAYKVLAQDYFFLGQPDKALAFAERGIVLSPLDPQLSTFLLFRGMANAMMRKDDEALEWLRRAAAASPDSPTILAALVSQLALTGDRAQAQAMLSRYLALQRTRTRTIAQWQHAPDDNAVFKQFDLRFKTGLRQAGMAEQ